MKFFAILITAGALLAPGLSLASGPVSRCERFLSGKSATDFKARVEAMKREAAYARQFTPEEIAGIRAREGLPQSFSDDEVAQYARNSARLAEAKAMREFRHAHAEALVEDIYGLDPASPKGRELTSAIHALLAADIAHLPDTGIIDGFLTFARLTSRLASLVEQLRRAGGTRFDQTLTSYDLDVWLQAVQGTASAAERVELEKINREQLAIMNAGLGTYVESELRLSMSWSGADRRVVALRDILARRDLPTCCQSGCTSCPYNYSTHRKLRLLHP